MEDLKKAWNDLQEEQFKESKRKKTILIVVVAVFIVIVSLVSINNIYQSKTMHKQRNTFVVKTQKLLDEHQRVLDLSRELDGVTARDYFTYEDEQLEKLKAWRETNNVTESQYDILVGQVRENAQALRDSYFLQPSFSDNTLDKYDYDLYKGDD